MNESFIKQTGNITMTFTQKYNTEIAKFRVRLQRYPYGDEIFCSILVDAFYDLINYHVDRGFAIPEEYQGNINEEYYLWSLALGIPGELGGAITLVDELNLFGGQ